MTLSAKGARDGGTLVESIERRTKKAVDREEIRGNWADRARAIAAKEVASCAGASAR